MISVIRGSRKERRNYEEEFGLGGDSPHLAAATAALTALGTTSCMGLGPVNF